MPYISHEAIVKAKRIASLWAKHLLAGRYGEWCILDTETTGLNRPEVIDICILSKYRSSFINTHLRPLTPIEQGATYIHGLTNESLKDAPSFTDVRDRIEAIVKDKIVIIYNADFDTRALFHTAIIHNAPRITFKSKCAMLKYAEYCGEWNNYWGNFKWQKLPSANHTAYGDCLAVYDLLEEMAAYADAPEEKELLKPRLFPPVQIACSWLPKYNIRIEKVYPTRWNTKLTSFEIKIPQFHLITDKDMEE
ncbi:3'-5' exonuclease [Tolypothrix sp. PCC 7601]|uniref:3'-5' exonuclease n=1 Tax=Tolypothrix sp. PCC 7601 TaxID=1188 RepID=UPI0021E093DB|nr:3'-5' exonuclease [Tolypothrix sp. PCC 7601]UYD38968.1 3'-5' exonuclease [Tolypothrix sp. PCC 7601]